MECGSRIAEFGGGNGLGCRAARRMRDSPLLELTRCHRHGEYEGAELHCRSDVQPTSYPGAAAIRDTDEHGDLRSGCYA